MRWLQWTFETEGKTSNRGAKGRRIRQILRMKSVLLVRQGCRGCRCIFDPIVSMRKRLSKCRWGKDETPCRSIPYPVRTIRTFRGPRLSNQSFSGLSSPQRHFSFPWRQAPPAIPHPPSTIRPYPSSSFPPNSTYSLLLLPPPPVHHPTSLYSTTNL